MGTYFFLLEEKKKCEPTEERAENDGNREKEENIQYRLLHVVLYVMLLNRHEYSIAWDCLKVVLFGFMYFNIDHHNADGVCVCVCVYIF